MLFVITDKFIITERLVRIEVIDVVVKKSAMCFACSHVVRC